MTGRTSRAQADLGWYCSTASLYVWKLSALANKSR
jgi:hypothetical protein